MNTKSFQFFTIPLIVFITCLLIYDNLFAYGLDAYREGEIIAEVRNKILTNYVEEVPSKKILEGALEGMLSKLDPYSYYLNEEKYKDLFESTEGEFIGIGIQISIEGGLPTIITPLDNSPAIKAGVLPGDKIIEIDDVVTDGFTLDDVVERLKGKQGTKVKIKVIHKGKKYPQTLEIIRDKISVASIKDSKIIDDQHKIGYFRLVKFNKHTKDDIHSAIEDLKKQGAKSLIIDLRFNPGGLLDAAVDVVDAFISQGIIVFTKGRIADSHRAYNATGMGTYDKIPLVVIINEYSASASEIVAGALQDYHRAVIVGERSYGKGSVQSILRLRDEQTGIRLTTAKYYTPSGRCIHKEPGKDGGVVPDITVKITDEQLEQLLGILSNSSQTIDNDIQLKQAVDILKN